MNMKIQSGVGIGWWLGIITVFHEHAYAAVLKTFGIVVRILLKILLVCWRFVNLTPCRLVFYFEASTQSGEINIALWSWKLPPNLILIYILTASMSNMLHAVWKTSYGEKIVQNLIIWNFWMSVFNTYKMMKLISTSSNTHTPKHFPIIYLRLNSAVIFDSSGGTPHGSNLKSHDDFIIWFNTPQYVFKWICLFLCYKFLISLIWIICYGFWRYSLGGNILLSIIRLFWFIYWSKDNKGKIDYRRLRAFPKPNYCLNFINLFYLGLRDFYNPDLFGDACTPYWLTHYFWEEVFYFNYTLFPSGGNQLTGDSLKLMNTCRNRTVHELWFNSKEACMSHMPFFNISILKQ